MPPPVVVVSTGGTIAMRRDPSTQKLVPAMSGEELVEMLSWPEAPPLELDDFARVPSFDVHGALALSLAVRVDGQAQRGDVAGVVVTHGTDTMEESVYLIDRLLRSDLPVVLTGAQRGADEPDTDGPRNLRDAVRVAAAEEARGRGAMIAFGGEIHAAREVRNVVVDLGAASRIGVETASALGAMADAMSSRNGALWIAAAWSDHAGYTLRPIQKPAPAGLLGICPALDRALDELIAAGPAGSPFESFETTTAA